ncbi:hypothetical protein DPMN_000595 [Dreissena polymorpha]|uniref:Uncharacterized protein n=1 Tax=Dreissena polymorpha TaxID=45954 RepID=A0A9D4MIG1_DREPO|nr:hypothetical protein DPMN_000595 [Dreissena polymorpha]
MELPGANSGGLRPLDPLAAPWTPSKSFNIPHPLNSNPGFAPDPGPLLWKN